MHTAILKLFPSVVNPVGMSKVQPFSTQIITPYTLDLSNSYQTLHLNSPLYVLYLCQISRQSDCILKSYRDFCKCAKKSKEKKLKFDHPYLMNNYCKLIKICCVASPRWWGATKQKLRAFLKEPWSHACVKIVF